MTSPQTPAAAGANPGGGRHDTEETDMANRDDTIKWLRERAETHRTGHPIVRDEKAARDCDEMADLAERRRQQAGSR